MDPDQTQNQAERMLRALIRKTRGFPGLRLRLKHPSPRVEVRLVGSAVMKRLNSRYRRKNYATDVLSFSAPELFRGQGALGELVICLPTLRKQAREQGHSERTELKVLLAHGLLHLLGFDHELGPREARRMAAWESRLLGRQATVKSLIERSQ